jgi:hypothetical protein
MIGNKRRKLDEFNEKEEDAVTALLNLKNVRKM